MRRALVGHPGIRDVAIKEEGDLVDITYSPDGTSVAVLCQQVMDTVVLPGIRNLLGRFSSSPP